MKVAHLSLWAPRASGLYEATKDLIKYERKLGLESEFVESEVKDPDPKQFTDGWLTAKPWSWAQDADLLVMHRSLPNELAHKQPKVVVMHGPIEIMMMFEHSGETDNFNFNINMIWDYDACVAITPQDYEIAQHYDEKERLRFIEDAVDLERYHPDGWQWEYQHHPAIVSADTIRLNKLPLHIILAMENLRKSTPDARLNFFSIPLADVATWRNVFVRSRLRHNQSNCELIQLMGTDVRPFVRGADISFNNNLHGIHSRASVMEAMAMGIPVVAYCGGEDYTPYIARTWCLESIAETIERCWQDILARGREAVARECRAYAHEHFSMEKAAGQYQELYEELLGKAGA